MPKLLLVEDDNNLREIYEARLQAEGYTIVAAKDGEEALATAKSEKPDLIISDVMMPKISGFEMLDILKNTDGLKNVKVIMLTALGQSDDQQRADTLGADRYLVKSQVTLEDIVRVAHELLEDGDAAAPAAEAPAPAAVTPSTEPATPAPAATPATPAPEPVAVTPAPEPATTTPAVTPAPAADTTTTTPATPTASTTSIPDPKAATAAASTSTTEAKATSEESADLEDQIQDIIEGASTEAPAPVEESSKTEATTPTPTPPTPETPIPTTTSRDSAASTAAADEKLMNEAVNSLVNEPANPAPAATTTSAASASEPDAAAESSAPALEETDTASGSKSETTAPAASTSTMSHEKVITPPADSEVNKKPDIQALFAAEQAKEAGVGDVVQPQPQAPTDKPIDPNSIAL